MHTLGKRGGGALVVTTVVLIAIAVVIGTFSWNAVQSLPEFAARQEIAADR
jgi:ABC-type thiamin/hydroxymethylpyrimidine transport system permease subunit